MCVIECHIDQCQRDGGGNDEGQQMVDWEEKEGKKYCGIEKNVVPLHSKRAMTGCARQLIQVSLLSFALSLHRQKIKRHQDNTSD